jgi:hypothetical protein
METFLFVLKALLFVSASAAAWWFTLYSIVREDHLRETGRWDVMTTKERLKFMFSLDGNNIFHD